jgi:hypothetical protein
MAAAGAGNGPLIPPRRSSASLKILPFSIQKGY